MGAAGEGARASRVHDSAEFGVLAMTMWRFDPAAGPAAA
jgi:4,5-DOPA dioxygenase extradiol